MRQGKQSGVTTRRYGALLWGQDGVSARLRSLERRAARGGLCSFLCCTARYNTGLRGGDSRSLRGRPGREGR